MNIHNLSRRNMLRIRSVSLSFLGGIAELGTRLILLSHFFHRKAYSVFFSVDRHPCDLAFGFQDYGKKEGGLLHLVALINRFVICFPSLASFLFPRKK